MEKASEKRVVTADEIAEMADNGENISRFYTGGFNMMPLLVRKSSASDQPVEIGGSHLCAEKSA